MKKEKIFKTVALQIKKLFTNKWFLGGIGGLLVFVLFSFFIYIYNPKLVPEEIKGTNKDIIDKVIGKDLSEKIDQTRDETGATSIRNIFSSNKNKEENKERHCEDKDKRKQEQDKCEEVNKKDNQSKKTYRNEELGYSVEVPEGWLLSNRTEELKSEGSLSKDTLESIFLDPVDNSVSKARFIIEVRNSYGVEGDLDRLLTGLVFTEKKTLEINGIQATFVAGSALNYETGEPENSFRMIIFFKGPKSYVINYVKSNDDQEDLNAEFETIYNSFAISN